MVVEVPDEEPTALVAYAFRSPTIDMVQLQHLASAMAVLLAQQNARREHERRIGAEVMGQLCDGRIAAAAATGSSPNVDSTRGPDSSSRPKALRRPVNVSCTSASADGLYPISYFVAAICYTH